MTALLALFQFIAFDFAWFAAVWGGANGWQWLGSLPAVAIAGLHLLLNRHVAWQEAKLIAAILLFGILLETGLMGAGLIRYAGMAPGQILPPVWIWALWLGFATIPTGSLTWLQGRGFVQMVFGAVFGPLAYWTGAKMGAATLGESAAASLFGIGLAWFLAFPALMLLADTISPRRPALRRLPEIDLDHGAEDRLRGK
jgi:hypothetical protein